MAGHRQPLSTFGRLVLPSEAATTRLAGHLAGVVRPGDTLLLDGPIGAGKTFFARALIHAILAREGRAEDVPSPTFTLVQTYDSAWGEIWHADLYRLSSASEVAELGLDDAGGQALVLVEWPDRLGDRAPPDALVLRFAYGAGEDERVLTAQSRDPSWADRLSGTGVAR